MDAIRFIFLELLIVFLISVQALANDNNSDSFVVYIAVTKDDCLRIQNSLGEAVRKYFGVEKVTSECAPDGENPDYYSLAVFFEKGKARVDPSSVFSTISHTGDLLIKEDRIEMTWKVTQLKFEKGKIVRTMKNLTVFQDSLTAPPELKSFKFKTLVECEGQLREIDSKRVVDPKIRLKITLPAQQIFCSCSKFEGGFVPLFVDLTAWHLVE